MQDRHDYEDLEEMRVPQEPDNKQLAADGGNKEKPYGTGRKAVYNTPAARQTRRSAKAQAKARENTMLFLVMGISFVVLLIVLVIVGIVMSNRAGTIPQTVPQQQTESTKLAMAAGKSYFKNDSNRPALSEEGVKGAITEAYYTEDGSLAVTLSLSNGKETDQRLSRLSLRLLNKEQDLIAEQSFDAFDPAIVVKAGSYESAYLVIDRSYVKLTDDPLSSLTLTLEITSAAV